MVVNSFLYFQATNDPYYLEVGKHIVEKINEHARVPCGFAALRDVRTLSHEDRYKYLTLTLSGLIYLDTNQKSLKTMNLKHTQQKLDLPNVHSRFID